MIFLKQSTASQAVLLGPFVDETDGKTAETGLTIANTDIRLSKTGGNMAAKNSGGGTHDEAGWYTATLDATDTNTVGTLQISVHVSGALPVWLDVHVLEEAIYDSLIGSGDVLDVNVTQWTSNAVAATSQNGVPEVDVTYWTGTATTLSSSSTKPEVDIASIHDGATSASNLELQYDGTTGLTGDLFPATQLSISGIGSGSSGAVNIKASEDNSGGAIIDGITIVGTPTGDYNNIHADTGGATILSVAHAGNDIDIVIGYDVGGARQGSSVDVVVNVNGNADSMTVEAYDHVGAGWDVIGIINGTGGSSYVTKNLPLYSEHTGTSGGELGKVYIRFDNNSTTPNLLEIDRCSVSAVSTATSTGYVGGAYWVSDSGTAGTEFNTNGTANNPCDWASFITMNGTNALNRVHVANGSTVTLSATIANATLFGEGTWTLALGGQSIEGLAVIGANVTGIGTATSTPPKWTQCRIGAVTLPPSDFECCGFGHNSGAFVAGSAGAYDLHQCKSLVPGTGSPGLTFTGNGSSTTIGNRKWGGGITLTLDADCTLSQHTLGGGGCTITTGGANCEIRGIARSLDITLGTSGTELVQFVGTTGPIDISGSATSAVVNLHGHSTSLTDVSSGSTVTDYTQSRANINTEVLDVLTVDTFAEPAQGTPAATTTILGRLQYLYKAWRNKSDQDSTTYQLYNDDASTVDHKATISDSAGTATKGEVATGP